MHLVVRQTLNYHSVVSFPHQCSSGLQQGCTESFHDHLCSSNLNSLILKHVFSYHLKKRNRHIFFLRRENASVKICQRTGHHKATIMWILVATHHLPVGTVLAPNRSLGRPRKVTAKTDSLMTRKVLWNSVITSTKLTKTYFHALKDVSHWTMHCRPKKELCLPSHAMMNPLLMAHMKQKPIQYVKKHEAWMEEDWCNILFSD